MKQLRSVSAILLAIILAFSMIGCAKKEEENKDSDGYIAIGKGETSFFFEVYSNENSYKKYKVSTDKTNVGDALSELNLIAGEESEYGLYVKTVDGITADYDKDKTYWAFYIDGEYASTGVDKTEIKDGAAYTFKIEK